ncbi:MAG: ATPase, T2SS/T4P/T4SS family, partial [Clostridium sp.]
MKEDKNNIYILTSGLSKEECNYLNFICEKNIVCEEISSENLKNIRSEIFNDENENLEENIIFKAIDDNASDIHFEPQPDWVNIRCRIHGTLILIRKIEKEEYIKILSKIKLMSGMDIAEKRKPQDGKINIEYKNKKYDL